MTRLTRLLLDQATPQIDEQTLLTQPTDSGSQLEPSETEILPPDISDHCEKCINNSLKGVVKKADTFIRLQNIIKQYPSNNQSHSSIQALRSYLSMLENHNNL